jgi:hypothetical protein
MSGVLQNLRINVSFHVLTPAVPLAAALDRAFVRASRLDTVGRKAAVTHPDGAALLLSLGDGEHCRICRWSAVVRFRASSTRARFLAGVEGVIGVIGFSRGSCFTDRGSCLTNWAAPVSLVGDSCSKLMGLSGDIQCEAAPDRWSY